jgi:ABC-type hemin transport system ATPase subunit
MVEIARAFVQVDERLELVILDEPTSSLDAGWPSSCWVSSGASWRVAAAWC